MRRKTRIVLLTGILLCTFLAVNTAAQAGNVMVVSLTNYVPHFTTDLSKYTGKRINLLDFDNQAKDTTLGYYFSLDKKTSYCGPSFIDNYFWYSCEKALTSLGMIVSNRNKPDPHAPAVWMSLKSLSDANFVVELKLQKFLYSVSFTKTYTITGEDLPAKPEQRTKEYLEKHAYNMTNKLFETILNDPEFKNTYFKAVADMAPSQVK
jgi:hypothetical protein